MTRAEWKALRVGDKVRLNSEFQFADVLPGQTGTVTNLVSNGGHFAVNGESGCEYTLWELVQDNNIAKTEADASLEQLVETANAGLAALGKIFQQRDNFQVSGGTAWNDVGTNHICHEWSHLRFRAKKKAPAFEPFLVGAWEVRLSEDEKTVHVGCHQFLTEDARLVLTELSKSGATAGHFRIGTLYATRLGILFNKHTLSWADADRILAALEKIK